MSQYQFKNDLNQLRSWINAQNNQSFDPYDLVERQPFRVLFQNYDNRLYKTFLRASQFFVFCFPVLSRKVLRVKKVATAGALYHHIMADLIRYRKNTNEVSLSSIRSRLQLVLNLREDRWNAWGLPFALSRPDKKVWPAFSPYTHTTLRVIDLFLNYEEITQDFSYREEWTKCLRFLFEGVSWRLSDQEAYCSYLSGENLWVFNVLADMAYQLVRLDEQNLVPSEFSARSKAINLIRSLLNARDSEGRWPYSIQFSDEPQDLRKNIIDSHHTAMILRDLGALAKRSFIVQEFKDIKDVLEISTARYIDDFFCFENGRPLCFLNDSSIIDIGCWPESVRAYVYVKEHISTDLQKKWMLSLERSYEWLRKYMRDNKDGAFYYQYRDYFGRYKLKSLRWGNALILEAMEFWREV